MTATSDTISARFAATAALRPDAVAIRHGGDSITYGALARRATAITHALRGATSGAAPRVGICLEAGIDRVAAVLGALAAGSAYVPLEPELPAARLAYLLGDADPAIVLAGAHTEARLPDGVRRLLADALALSEGDDAPVSWTPPAGDDLAYILYTSGSTGDPKGACIDHAAVLNLVDFFGERFCVGPGDGVLHVAPLAFDVSVWEMFVPLLRGATCCVADRDVAADPEQLTRRLLDDGVTIVDVVPHVLDVLDPERLPGLRVVMTGMEAFRSAVIERWQAPGREVFNGYGPTECTVIATLEECTTSWDAHPRIGQPIGGMRGTIEDADGAVVPDGDAGELVLRGVGVGRGYWRRPELTAERFGLGGERSYRTGDRVRRLTDGALEFLGRADDQLSIRGHRLEPGEIEACLRRLPAVRDAVVLARDDAAGYPLLVAAIVPEPGASVTAATLRAHAAEHLPAHAVPARYELVERFPMSPNGKVDRQRLAAAPEPAPAPLAVSGEASLDAVVRAEWCAALGAASVAPDDDFMGQGGDSLIAMRLVGRLRERLRRDVTVAMVMKSRSYTALIATIDAAGEDTGISLLDLAAEDPR